MTQPKKWSLVELLTNIAVGFGIAVLGQLFLWPVYGIHVQFRTNFWLSVWFTVISIIRSYCLRRIFNRRTEFGAN